MKVILLKDIGGVGKRNTVKEMSDGYALNYLIPKGLAKQATAEQIAKLQVQMKHDEAHAQAQSALAAKEVKALQDAEITIATKANEQGHLYRQVSPEIVSEAVNKIAANASVTAHSVHLEGPIKTTGVYAAKINVGAHSANITIKVVAA
jgi:large subunit ribosomal protein L9